MFSRKKAGLVAVLTFVGMVATLTGATMATAGILRIGGSGFLTSSVRWDSLRGRQTGGWAQQYIADAAETLKVGELVFLDTNNAVGKSATLADYNAIIGVVVGGQRLTGNGAATDSSDLGTTVATDGQKVWVLRCGRTWMTTADSTYAGSALIPGAVAGRPKRRTTAIDTFGRVFGKAVFRIDSGKPVVVDVCVK